jgi:iron complex transport system ATP-binding protein
MKYFSCEKLNVGYGKKKVIKDVSVSFSRSKITGIIGPNGSGKSTLLKAMGRLLKPFSGEVFVNNLNIKEQSDCDVARHVGILPQAPTAPMDTPVHCLVSYGRNPHKKMLSRMDNSDRETVDWAIESTGLKDKRFSRLGQLSGGERQRAWIAMALAQQPNILLLDEPTTYLDIHHQFEVLELIEKLNGECGLTVVMVLHDLNLAARFSHRIVALKEGRICRDGEPEDILTESNICEVFNVRSKVVSVEDNIVAVPVGVV